MKKTIILFAFIFAFAMNGSAQVDSASLLSIEFRCLEMEVGGFTRIDTVDFNCEARFDFGSIRYYFLGEEIVYIEMENGDLMHTVYFKSFCLENGVPIYCYTSMFADGDPRENGTPTVFEIFRNNIYYILEGEAFYCLEKDYRIHTDSAAYFNPDDHQFIETNCAFYNEFIATDFRTIMAVYELSRTRKDDCLWDLVEEQY